MSSLATIDNNATGSLALFDTIAEMGHEQVVMCYDKSSGYRGVIAVHGIVRYLVEHFPETVYNLPPNPKSVQRAREGA